MSASAISCPSASKSGRGRPLGQTARDIRTAVVALTGDFERMTVRQVFYKLETLGIVEKTEGGYRQVQQQVLKMRREGVLPWAFITDGTRWQRKPESWNDAEDYLLHMAQGYRRDLWRSQNVRIEIWLEKDALADMIVDVTSEWDVPLMVSRGQSSATFLEAAARQARSAWDHGIRTIVYALYDRDAGGLRAARAIQHELPAVAVNFAMLAVTDDQIREWSLPTRPAKSSDPEAKKFQGPAVELDAIPPDKLVALVDHAIRRHIDPHAWKLEEIAEEDERRGLLALTGRGA